MPAAFQSNTNATTLASTTVVDRPSGTVDGDLLIVGLVRNGANNINSVPSGWTALQSGTAGGAGVLLSTYWKIASSEPSTWTWGWDGSNTNKGWFAIRINSHDGSSPIGASNVASVDNDGTPSWANAITPARTDSLLVMAMVARSDSSAGTTSYAIATSNPTWTERIDVSLGGSTTMAVATALRPEATSTGNSSATFGVDSGVEDSVCVLIAVNRVNTFSASLTDTVNVSDSVAASAVYKRLWRNEEKPSTTWSNPSK